LSPTATRFGAKGRARSGAQHRGTPCPVMRGSDSARFYSSRDSRRLRLRMLSLTSSRPVRLRKRQQRRLLLLQRSACANPGRQRPASTGSIVTTAIANAGSRPQETARSRRSRFVVASRGGPSPLPRRTSLRRAGRRTLRMHVRSS
jgi:hypothetical protein